MKFGEDTILSLRAHLKYSLLVVAILVLEGCATTSLAPMGQAAPTSATSPLAEPEEGTDVAETTIIPAKPSPVDLWDRIRRRLALKHATEREAVKKQIVWFQSHPDFFDRSAERAEPVLHYIVEMVESRRMPAEVALLPITESAYNPLADSPVGAGGIWQIMPATAKNLGLRQSWWYDGRRDLHASSDAALNYLAYLYRYFDGDWLLAFAAYNAGEGTVSKAVQRNRNAGKPTDFWSLKLPKETSVYVPSLLALSEVVANPAKYSIKLRPIVNQGRIVKVAVKSQIDLSFAAQIADLKVEALYKLNPGFFRWATDPEGPHYLMLPQKNAELFQKRLSQLAAHERIAWQRYQVRRGDTLLSIANKYHASPEQIRAYNKLKTGPLTPGRTIQVPKVSRVPNTVVLPRILPSAARAASKTVKGAGVKWIIVKKGDTLSKLGKRYKVSVKQLAGWNNLPGKARLSIGQKLKIFVGTKTHPKKSSKRGKKRAAIKTKKIR